MHEEGNMKKQKSLIRHIVFGIIIAALLSGAFFYTIDSSKGWNPYGWWFIATFFSSIIGGLIGLFTFGYRVNRKTDHPKS